MANNIIIGSEFKPFSYQEMLAPVLMAQQQHQAIEDAYSELETKANVWDQMADEENDPIAYNRFKQYSDALRAEAEALSTNGLTSSSRRRMLGLKSRYASDIAPIEQAYKRRRELQDEQRKALLSNPTLMFQRNLNNIGYESSLDRFIENQNYDYGESVSGALLTQQVATKAAALAKELRDTGEKGRKARAALEKILPYQYRVLEQPGFSSQEILKAIQDPNANPILTDIVNSTLESSGISEWADKATMNKARAYANEGLWSAIGKQDYKYITDEFNMKKALEKASPVAPVRSPAGDKEIDVNPASLYTKAEKDNFSRMQNNIKTWLKQGYLRKQDNGNIVLTRKGLSYANSTKSQGSYGSTVVTWKDATFRRFLVDVGAVYDKKAPKISIGSASAAHSSITKEYQLTGWRPSMMNAYMRKIEGGYDATRDTEFIHDYVTEAEQTRAKNMIRRALGNGDAQVVSYKGPKQGYTDDPSTISKDKFVSDYTVLASKGSKFGQVFVVENADNEQLFIRVPEVHREHQASTIRYYTAAEDAYKQMDTLKPRVSSISAKMKAGTPYESLSAQEKKTLIDYYSYNDTYKDMIQSAEREQGRITRGYKTDDIKIE